MTHGQLDDEGAVLDLLRDMYAMADPAPDMAPRVLFALDLDRIDVELAAVSEEFAGSLGARGTEGTRTITFDSSSLRVIILVPGNDNSFLDGWIEPAASLRIVLVTPDARLQTRSDEGGRFAFEAVLAGQIHLEIHPTPGSAVHLTRPVVTQRVVL
ncbi:MAG TPA: hypothetical protein VFC00_16760 [Micromonosporaceae bacterium]|nr:hypothetical protein [Micromonosporaceae bacterium]